MPTVSELMSKNITNAQVNVQTWGGILVNVKTYGAKGDGTTDDTAAIQAAIDYVESLGGGIVFFPEGTYITDHIALSGNVILTGIGESSILKHKANATDHMIELTATGISAVINNLTLDGNNANQPIPNSFSLVFSKQGGNSLVDPMHLKIYDVFFKDVSYGGIYFYGDYTTTTLEKLDVYNCKFIGGKESTSTFNPRFIGVLDGAEANIHDNYFDFGSDPVASPFPAVWVSGTQTAVEANNRVTISDNVIKRCGRNVSGSGIGAVGCYIWGDYVNISNNKFIDSYVSAIRFKANSKNMIITGNHINKVYDLDLEGYNGIHMTPLTSGTVESNLVISNNIIENIDNGSGIYIDSASGQVYGKVIIESNIVDTCAKNGIFCDYLSNVAINSNDIKNITEVGITILNTNTFTISGNIIESTTLQGITFNVLPGLGKIEGNLIVSASSNGIQNTGGPTTGKLYISDNLLSSITSNAFALEDILTAVFNGNYIETAATGYRIGGNTNVIIQGNYNSDVTTNVNVTSAITNFTETGNSWNRKETFASAAPTTGTHARGDLVWNTLPAASGTIGFVCVTAGSPGTWKTFGTISA